MSDSQRIDGLTCSPEEAADWRKRAAEVARNGERAAVAQLCPDCYGVLPYADNPPGVNHWPGVKYCGCGLFADRADVLRIVGATGNKLGEGVTFKKASPTDGSN